MAKSLLAELLEGISTVGQGARDVASNVWDEASAVASGAASDPVTQQTETDFLRSIFPFGGAIDRTSEFYTGRPAIFSDSDEPTMKPVAPGTSRKEVEKAEVKLRDAETRNAQAMDTQLAMIRARLDALNAASQAAPEDVFVATRGSAPLRNRGGSPTRGSFSRSNRPVTEQKAMKDLMAQGMSSRDASTTSDVLDGDVGSVLLKLIEQRQAAQASTNPLALFQSLVDSVAKSRDPIAAREVMNELAEALLGRSLTPKK